MTDDKVARKLFRKLKRLYYSRKGLIVIGDKAYDIRERYNFFEEQIKVEPIIPSNPRRNTRPNLKYSANGHRICSAGLEMIPNGVFKHGKRSRLINRLGSSLHGLLPKSNFNYNPRFKLN
ncbi:hypothetical protein ACFL0M_10870 [Thermodesulfobacteriota bacterium]